MSTDWSGDDYSNVSGLQREMARLSLASLDFGDSAAILDVGCGDGFITRSIAAAAPRAFVAGLDPSPLMVATAHRASPVTEPGPRYVLGDAVRLPFAAHFDTVVSFNALHWVHDQQGAFDQIAAVLRPSGWALVQMVCEGERSSIEDVMQDLSMQPTWSAWFDEFSAPHCHSEPDRVAQMVAAAGLEVKDCVVAEREWDFGSREAFARWCAVGAGAWTARLDSADRERFVDEAVSDYENVAGRPGLFKFLQIRVVMTRPVTFAR